MMVVGVMVVHGGDGRSGVGDVVVEVVGGGCMDGGGNTMVYNINMYTNRALRYI